MSAAERVRSVKHKLELVPLRDLLQRLNMSRPTPQMDPNDPRRARGNHASDRGWIKIVCRDINVGEHRRDLLPLQRVRCGNERVGRHNDFAVQLKRPDCYFERDGAIAHCNTVLDPKELRHTLLKLLHHRSIVA